jgi:D-3-phosphoglycerate dehydrogenase
MTPAATRQPGSTAPVAQSGHRVAIVADCDHPTIDIEQGVLASTCGTLRWLACRTEDEVIAQCGDAEGLLIQYAPLTRRVLEQLPRCRIVARYGVGVDTIDLQAAADHRIVVCNVPDYGTHEVSDHALGLMLCLTRKLAQANSLVKRGQWDFRLMQPVRRHQIQTIGIIGVGRIGGAMAQKSHALGMRVLGCDPYLGPDDVPSFVTLVDLPELLAQSDVVSVHCPLTDETRNLIDATALAKMKPSAFLINTARGSIVDEVALEQRLHAGKLAGAALDVLAREPGTPDHPLFRYDNFLCTPHMAWHSDEAMQELKRKAAEEVRRVLHGEPPLYQMNKF